MTTGGPPRCTALPATHWPFSNLRLCPVRFIEGVPYSRPSSISRVDLSSCREKQLLRLERTS